MRRPENISVIITTYNSIEYLSRVLAALSVQDCSDFEVIVADDGSTQETTELIEKAAAEYRYPLLHVWHEDNGFRAAAIRNVAVSQSSGDYLVFLDGDCLALENFITKHRYCAEPGYLVRGSRIMLKEAFTKKLLADQNELPNTLLDWIKLRLSDNVKRIFPIFGLPYRQYAKAKKWPGVKTCNLGIWRKDFEAVNGFDESYIGWGHEDADIAVRLIRHGIKRKEGRSQVPVIHLWHQENDRSHLSDNEGRLQTVISASYTWTEPGLSNHQTLNHP